MEHLDPRVITAADWTVISSLTSWWGGLWGLVICNYLFATSMLLAHIIIPSLVASGHIPATLHRARPALTVFGVICLIGTTLVVLNFLNNLAVIYDIYPRRFM